MKEAPPTSPFAGSAAMRPRSKRSSPSSSASPLSSSSSPSSSSFFAVSSSTGYYVSFLAIAIITVAQLRGVYESCRGVSIVLYWYPLPGSADFTASSSSDLDDPYYASILAQVAGQNPTQQNMSSKPFSNLEGSFDAEETASNSEIRKSSITNGEEAPGIIPSSVSGTPSQPEAAGRAVDNLSDSAATGETESTEPVPDDAALGTSQEETRHGMPGSSTSVEASNEPGDQEGFKFEFSSPTSNDSRDADSAGSATDRDDAPPSPSSAGADPTAVYYSVAKTDRAGATIRDMVMALAYGYAHNKTYGGACYVSPAPRDSAQRQADKDALIASIGLQEVLKFACPESFHVELLQPEEYTSRAQRTRLVSPEFVTWLRSKVTLSGPNPGSGGMARGGEVAVHVRRGDVDPCSKTWADRYLPNSYYQDVLRRYVPPDRPVTIFSESWSFEEWTEFSPPRYDVRLDTDLAEVWRSVMAAQYIVLSYSSFVYIPALLNPNATVLYAPTWQFVPMPHWIKVDMKIRRKSAARVKKLASAKCSGHKSLLPGTSQLRGATNESLMPASVKGR